MYLWVYLFFTHIFIEIKGDISDRVLSIVLGTYLWL